MTADKMGNHSLLPDCEVARWYDPRFPEQFVEEAATVDAQGPRLIHPVESHPVASPFL